MASAEVLDYSHLGWADSEANEIFDIFPWCHSLKKLLMGHNKITDVSRLCDVLDGHSIRHIDLRGNPLSTGVKQLKAAWKAAGLKDGDLQVSSSSSSSPAPASGSQLSSSRGFTASGTPTANASGSQ